EPPGDVEDLELRGSQDADAAVVAEAVQEELVPVERAGAVVPLRPGEEQVADVGGGDRFGLGQAARAEGHEAVERLDGGLLVGLALGEADLLAAHAHVPGVARRAIPGAFGETHLGTSSFEETRGELDGSPRVAARAVAAAGAGLLFSAAFSAVGRLGR